MADTAWINSVISAADTAAETATNAAATATGEEMSVFKLVMEAGLMVQMVMLLLLAISVISWAIIFLKAVLLRKAKRESDIFLKLFWESRQLDEIYNQSKALVNSPIVEVFAAGYVELQRFRGKGTGFSETSDGPGPPKSPDTARENIQRALLRAKATEVTKLEKAVPFLATAGNTSPFIGLFGTVWGIMNSFHGISAKGSAGLGAVSQGISEALIATAMGLFAAIPAVVAYNYFVNRIRVLENDINSFSSEFMNILERHVLNK